MAIHATAGPSESASARAHRLIPGGAHTYSKDDAHFAPNVPPFILSGRGAEVVGSDGLTYLDWGMGLRSVLLGHTYEPVLERVRVALSMGANHTRPTLLEGELAERLVDLIPCAEMVKFGKNGSDATTAAVRLARAATGRPRVLACDGSFHASDDWWLSSQPLSLGAYQQGTGIFPYNDLVVLENGLSQGDVAAVILEPMAFDQPAPGFLEGVRALCTKYGAVMIFDEVITGFRFGVHGAGARFGVRPDLATFGKGIANGFSVSALVGSRSLMSTAGVHLLSSTHGGETHALAAAIATIDAVVEHDVPRHLARIGALLQSGMALLGYSVRGDPCSPNVDFKSDRRWPPREYMRGQPSTYPVPVSYASTTGEERMAFQAKMAARGILAPYWAPSFAHTEDDVDATLEAAAA